MGEIGELWIKIGAKMEGLTKAHSDIEKTTDKIAKSLNKIGKDMTIIGGAIIGTLGVMIKKTADYGDEMWDLSQRTGVSVETLTGFKLAADKSGTSIDGMATGFRKLADNMVEANKGTKTSKDLFDALEISVVDSTGNLRSMDDVMLDVADRFSKMQDGALKATLAQDLFGRSGMELIPLLNMGAQGLRDERDRAQELGIVLSKDAAQGSDKFNDSLTELKTSVQGAGISLGSLLMPPVKDFIEAATNIIAKVRAWADEHPGLSSGLATAALALGGLLTAVGPLLIMLPKLIEGWRILKGIMSTSIGTIGGVAAAAGVAYVALNAMIDAKNKATEAAWQASEKERILGQRLREVADATGMSRKELHDLYLKYGESNQALTTAIRKGEEGAELQKTLADNTKKHAEASDLQSKAQKEAEEWQRRLNAALAGQKDAAEPAIQTTETLTLKLGDLYDAASNVPGPFENVMRAAQKMAYDSAQAVEDGLLTTIRDEIPTEAEKARKGLGETAEGIKSDWENAFTGLFNDIATGFGNTVQTWFEGSLTFKDFLLQLWDDIKTAFFRMVGEMIATWTLKLMKKMVESAADTAKDVAKSVGGVTKDIASAAGKAASGFLSSLGSVGSIITGITSLISLLKGPQKQTDVTYWLKMIWENTKESRDWLFINAEDKLAFFIDKANEWHVIFSDIRERLDTSNSLQQTMVDNLRDIASHTEGMLGALEKMPKAQSGLHIDEPGFVYVHPNETIMPDDMLAQTMAGGAGANVQVQIQPIVIPRKDAWQIEFLIKTIKDLSKGEHLIVHPKAIRPF